MLAPEKHPNVPPQAKWLSGQGEGTWFTITKDDDLNNNEYRVRRTSQQGNLDCDRIFTIKNNSFDFTKPWDIAHVSHCAIVKVKQNNTIFELTFLREFN